MVTRGIWGYSVGPRNGHPMSCQDWQALFDGYDEFMTPTLKSKLPTYAANVRLDTDLGQWTMHIQDGKLTGFEETLAKNGADFDYTVQVSNLTLASLLANMKLDAFSAHILAEMAFQGSWEDFIGFVTWINTAQEALGLDALHGPVSQSPVCVEKINAALENDHSALKNLLQDRKTRIAFVTQPGGILLDLRKGKVAYFGPLTSAPRKDDLVFQVEPDQALRLVSGEFRLLPGLVEDGTGSPEEKRAKEILELLATLLERVGARR